MSNHRSEFEKALMTMDYAEEVRGWRGRHTILPSADQTPHNCKIVPIAHTSPCIFFSLSLQDLEAPAVSASHQSGANAPATPEISSPIKVSRKNQSWIE